jgi:pimeloyl-ACP methyl ester carboxylesterase
MLAAVPAVWAAALSEAGEVKLKSGATLKGTPSETRGLSAGSRAPAASAATSGAAIVRVSNPLQQYFVPEAQVASVDTESARESNEVFALPQQKQSGAGRNIVSVNGFRDKPPPFDQFGRRTVNLEMAQGAVKVFQGVTEIAPTHLRIIALNYVWETTMATSAVPSDVLDAMLRTAVRADNPDDRLRIARFYLQAGRFELAQRELESIEREFPNKAAAVKALKAATTQAMAHELLNELLLRRAAGQHQFVSAASKAFPIEGVAAPVLQEARDIAAQYETARERSEKIVAQLADLQSALKGHPRIKEIAPLRDELAEKLNDSTLDRLDAFFKLAADPQLKPEEKMALALSGWVVGSANAATEIGLSLRLWEARDLVLEYLRAAADAEGDRRAILRKLEVLDGVGPERIAQMIPRLPPTADVLSAAAARTVRIPVELAKGAPPAAYWVTLPLEYHAGRLYPLIIALHSESGGAQQEIDAFWGGPGDQGGQAHRHGYIVIAPEYIEKGNTKGYDYGARSHQIVVDSLRDARQHFAVDSDRVFLAGHGMGGDAAWDIGLSHPHLFAGVIPINSAIDRHAKYYVENGRQVAFYAVSGELDRDQVTRNAAALMQMMQQNFDLVDCEYAGAGPESFYSEVPSLFAWMSNQKRRPLPRQVVVKSLRESDNRFYWYEFSGFPESMKVVDWSAKGRARPMPVSAKLSDGNTLVIQSAAAHTRLWLTPDDGLFDFNKRLNVRINGKSRFNEFVKPDTAAMLEHVRLTGDRQQLYWAVLEF